MNTQKGNKLIPAMSKEDYLRESLIKFARKENIDPNIFKSNFVVEEYEKEFFVFLGEVECNFTCSIGYNRTENYVEMEKKQKLIKQYDGSSKWEWVTEPVNKTRTVTDWQPYSGVKKGNVFSVVKSNGEWDEECGKIEKLVTGKSEEYDENIEISNEVMTAGEEILATEYRVLTKFGLPGDKYNDFNSDEKVEVLEVRRYVVPYYKLKYNFKGKQKSCDLIACSNSFTLSLDNDEKEELKFKPKDTKKIATERVKPLTKMRNLSWLAIVPVGILLGILRVPQFLGSVIPLVIFVVAIILSIKRSSEYNSIKSQLDKQDKERKDNILNEKHKQVYNLLKTALSSHGLRSVKFDEVYSNLGDKD